MSQNDTFADKIDILYKAVVPLLCLLVTWQYNQYNTLENRFYSLQRETVTKEELKELKQDIIESQQKQYNDIIARIELMMKNNQK